MVVGIWVAIAGVFITQNIVSAVAQGRPVPWLFAVGFEAVYWIPWLLFTPLLVGMIRRIGFDERARTRAIILHILAGLAWGVVQTAVYDLLRLGLVTALEPPESRIRLLNGIISSAPALILTALWKYWVMVGVCLAFDYSRQLRERRVEAARLESELTSARLQALEMQLHPHFLFNTLNSASMLTLMDPPGANRVLVMLGDLLRATLRRPMNHQITLHEELAFLDRYLEIESIRFQDRLTIRILVEEQALPAQIPPFILQPLVENAIRHGISSDSSAGVLEMRGRREAGELVVEIIDDGPGVGPGERVDGIGIRNVQDRLAHLFGARASLTIRAMAGRGTVAQIRLPFEVAPTEAERVA